ncbi:diaminopimelate decarboxylase [Pelistega ratti]|nr:diaminopimelate decarboxylase [Pelistega ratti]
MMTTLPIPVASPFFHYHQNQLFVENCSIKALAQQYGTPLFVYSKAALVHQWHTYQKVIDTYPNTLICYAVKANSNLAILNLFAKLGAGFDLVSGGELFRVLKAGGDPAKVIFSGVAKQVWEIEAALDAGIKCFNVESIPELDLIAQVAQRLGKKAPISLRVNPDVDAKTHPYISTGLKENKFGIDINVAAAIYQKALDNPFLEIKGVDCHIGSQITEVAPFVDAADKVIALLQQLKEKGIALSHIDMGGGLGIRYLDEEVVEPLEMVRKIKDKLHKAGFDNLQLVLEPGRSLVGNTGVLLTQVQFIKPTEARCFAIVDAAMNDLIRPTLYDAYHGVLPVLIQDIPKQTYDIVGPICETGDWLAKQRELAIQSGDYLVVESTGAYGFSMASQYNTRPRAAEILVDGEQSYLIRERETLAQLVALEHIVE